MKKTLLTGSILLASILSVHAQTYTDNFDSYTAGDNLSSSSTVWSTWSGASGGADDTKIDTVKSFSGDNSIYFQTSAANGGPQDALMSLGGEYDLGNFEFTTQMFVESNKGGYFNIQSTSTAGQTYQVSAYFVQDGTLKMRAPGIDIDGSFPTNAWFEYKMVANLNNSSWEIFIDNVSIGSYVAPEIQIASFNFFPVNPAGIGGNNNASYWLDDVSYTHTPYTLPQVNGGLLNFNIPTLISGQTKVPKVNFRNIGLDDINSVKVEFEYDGNTNTETFNLSSALASKDVVELVPTTQITLVNGANELKATILEVNGMADSEMADNVTTMMIDPIVPADGKIVIAEEGTGTWCGWCPRGAVAMETAAEEYKGYFQGIAVHNGDPMVNSVYDTGLGGLINGYPSALVDRGNDIDPGNIPSDFFQRLTVQPKATMVNGATFDAATNELNVSLTVNIAEDITNNWKVACAIVENNVTGTASGYNQSNYYAGGSNGVMGGYESLPGTVPAAQMVYHEVARSISPSFAGFTGFADVNTAGTSKTFNFTFQLESGWKSGDMHIVGLLMDASGKIDNGSTSTIAEAVTEGYVSGTNVLNVENFDLTADQISTFPNPVSDVITVQLSDEVEGDLNYVLTDVLGKTIYTGTTNQESTLTLNVSDFKKGVYFLTLSNASSKYVEKVIVE